MKKNILPVARSVSPPTMSARLAFPKTATKAVASPDTHYTVVCRFAKNCLNPDCKFAHTAAQFRVAPWRVCHYGVCCRNNRCTFVHPGQKEKFFHDSRNKIFAEVEAKEAEEKKADTLMKKELVDEPVDLDEEKKELELLAQCEKDIAASERLPAKPSELLNEQANKIKMLELELKVKELELQLMIALAGTC